jgi:hypothetical protein
MHNNGTATIKPIRAFICEGSIASMREESFATVEKLWETMDTLRQGEVIVHFPDDRSYYMSCIERGKRHAQAVKALQFLTGAQANAWFDRDMSTPMQHFRVYTDGDGWRVIYSHCTLNSNQPQMPPKSLLSQ